MGILTNGHVELGLKDGDSKVPALPLLQSGCRGRSRLANGYNVVDADGNFMAFFRNKEEADNYCETLNGHSNR